MLVSVIWLFGPDSPKSQDRNDGCWFGFDAHDGLLNTGEGQPTIQYMERIDVVHNQT